MTDELKKWRKEGNWDKVNQYMCEHAKDDKELQNLIKRLEGGVVKQWNEQIGEDQAKVVVPGVTEGVGYKEITAKELFKKKQYADCTLLLILAYEDYWKGSWFLVDVMFHGDGESVSELFFN